MSLKDQEKSISRVLHAIEIIKSGGMVIMVDDENRENEGDLVFAATFVNPAKINFMAKEARGLICLALEPAIVQRLNLPMMGDSTKGANQFGTAFTVSIEAKRGVTTGISAHDRSETIRIAADKNSTPDDIVVPGHIFPLRAREGGVLERAGQTEGSVDLAKLAGLEGAAVICEIMNEDGSMARMPDLERLAKKHELHIISVEDIITFRHLKESFVEIVSEKNICTEHGIFKGYLIESKIDNSLHFALTKGEPFAAEHIVDVRVHNQRPLIDVFANKEIGGRTPIDYGLNMLRESDRAVLVYLTSHNDQHYKDDFEEMYHDSLQDLPQRSPLSTTKMDLRTIGTGAQILKKLGVRAMRVHLSSSRPLKGLAGFGLEVVETKIIGH